MEKIDSKEFYLILKLGQTNSPQFSKENVKIKKILSSISPSNFIKLMHYANNDINPRNATNNKIARDIDETLQTSPELFWLKTKGIVLATKHCEVLDRNRIKISFYNPELADEHSKKQEGIMDGGHNAFAIAYYIANVLFEKVKKWKKWNDFKKYWDDNYEGILEEFDKKGGDEANEFKFSIPIEIISPNDENDDSEYCDAISEICDARNNNAPLGQPEKDNQEGCYDYLKQILPTSKYSIIWKSGQESGNIRVEDVVSMAVIPFIYLQSIGKLSEDKYGTINKVSVYSQKGACVKFFSKVLQSKEFSAKPTGSGQYVLKSDLIKSALDLTEDIMKFFDLLYKEFPYMYNKAGGSFGRITDVKVKDNTNYLFKTIDEKAEYRYSYGFFYPLLCGITEFMQYDEETDTVLWKVNPTSASFNIKDLDIKLFTGFFSMSQYNPNVIGKSASFYDAAAVTFKNYISK